MNATVSNSSGDALFTTDIIHGLTDGDYIYIKSYIENYNGFWYVDQISTTTFKIKSDSSADAVSYIKDGTVTYYVSDADIDWACAHLPITYEIESDLFPTNSFDTARTVSSYSNSYGYLTLSLSGSLGTFEELDFVKISGATTASLNGTWQILDKLSTSSVTLNIPYISSYDTSGASVILFYNSYHIVVNVYAGIATTHDYTDQKPYELAATLRLIPGSDNKVTFSINEIIKGYVESNNNLLLGTLPNNIDAWCNYYIEYAESYDQSSGYTVSTYQSDFTTHSFEGYAVNSKLAFKNIYSGNLSEYVMKYGLIGKFLTLFTIPVIFACSESDCYQDVSFIIQADPLADEVAALSTFINKATGLPKIDWSLGSAPSVTLASGEQSKDLQGALSVPAGVKSLTISITVTGTDPASGQMLARFRDSSLLILGEETKTGFSSGTNILRFDFGEIADTIAYLEVFTFNGGSTDLTFVVNSYSIGTTIANAYFRRIYFLNGSEQITEDETISLPGGGVYRHQINNVSCDYDEMKAYIFVTTGFYEEEVIISEIKEFEVNCDCADYEITLTWQNNLGGFDYWKFTAAKDYITDIVDSGEQTKNILPTWPSSYGEFADTINRQTFRESRKQIKVRSQAISLDNLDAVCFVRESVLVQVINSRYDRRTVIVDSDSFTRYNEEDNEHYIEFTITFTDSNPVQRV